MPYTLKPGKKAKNLHSFFHLAKPAHKTVKSVTPLLSRGNRDLKLTFEDQLNGLILYHLEEYESGRHLLQVLKEDGYVREHIAPKDGIEKSSFFEAMNNRGLQQLLEVFSNVCKQAQNVLPKEHQELDDLTLIDGSLIDATLSMHWADYRKGSKKAKAHLGFDLNHSIPCEIFLTDGKGDERPFVSQILSSGQTGVMDRYYQCHKNFDQWQDEGKHFICRLRSNTKKTLIEAHEVVAGGIVFYDATVQLGTSGANQTTKPVRLVGYRVEGTKYWIATDRYDLSAEQIAMAYKLRWNIEIFFGWWKRHLHVYHLIARTPYGLMVQMVAGLITYVLLAIYCHNNFGEKISIRRVRQLRIQIKNELREMARESLQYELAGLSHCARAPNAKV